MNHLLNKNILVTTSDWFMAPDGLMYRAIWGKLTKIYNAEDLIGFTPNRQHTNWVYEIGRSTVMGCRIMYIIECESEPVLGDVTDFSTELTLEDKKSRSAMLPTMTLMPAGSYERPTQIFNANSKNE